MSEFKRIKIQATVETEGLLLPEAEVAPACEKLRERLAALDLAVLAVEPREEAGVEFPESLAQELD
jgi:hypothetical protein